MNKLGTPIPLDQWFEEFSISERMQQKLRQLKIVEVIPAGKGGLPITMISSVGVNYKVFLIQDSTSEFMVEGSYFRWIKEHINEIKTDHLPFFIIQDTRTIRFETRLYRMGLRGFIVSRASERLYKREDLIKKLQKIADKISDVELPTTIDEIHVFGSILREKERVPDIDVYLKCSKSEQQRKKIENIRNTLQDENNPHRNYILEALWEENRETRRSIKNLVKESEKFRIALNKIGYPAEWFQCITWSHIYRWLSMIPLETILFPEEKTIIRKLLVGNLKGFKDFYILMRPTVAKNTVLAWSLDRPNVKKNIDERPEGQKLKFLEKELDNLIVQMNHFHKTIKPTLDLENFSYETPIIERTGKESKEELLTKIEVLRNQLKKIKYRWPNRWKPLHDKNNLEN
ncbi:MAG: hypothetical protein HWN66_11585 [Candidatus Helarchaeota archaeon]|nr:hypothetical protein [Candidatus Helarchaeota archaeon]